MSKQTTTRPQATTPPNAARTAAAPSSPKTATGGRTARPPQTILITGATSGIGRHAALTLARRGHRVFATGRRQHALDSLQVEAEGLRLEALRLDVTDDASIEAARDEIVARTGGHGVDIIVNNAGYGHLAPTELVSDADMRAQFDTNVFGLMAVTRAFMGPMRQRGSGRIINVSSVGGRLTLPLFGVYNATKYAVESLSDALRMELGAFGIHVSLIEPGVIDTGFADVSMNLMERYQGGRAGDYEPIVARADQLKAQTDRMAVGPKVISHAITRAAESRRPRARYVAPFRARVMLAFAGMLPTRWVDGIMRLSLGMTRRRLAPRGDRARVAA